MKKINDFVFQGDVNHLASFVYQEYEDVLHNAIGASPTLRSRILLHKSTSEKVQKMIIAFDSKSHIPLVSHVFSETFICISGEGRYMIYDDGNGYRDIMLGSYESGHNFMVIIPKYTIEPKEERQRTISIKSNDLMLMKPIKTYDNVRLEEIESNGYVCNTNVFQLNKEMIEQERIRSGKIFAYKLGDVLHEREYILVMCAHEQRKIVNGVIHAIHGACVVQSEDQEIEVKKGTTCIIRKNAIIKGIQNETILHVVHDRHVTHEK